MMSSLSELGKQYWWAGGTIASLMWLWGGKQYAAKAEFVGGVSWQCIALIIIVIVAGWTIAENKWVGLAVAILVFAIEVRELRRTFRQLQAHD